MQKTLKTFGILIFTVCAALVLQTATAKTCELEITGNDKIQYNKSKLVVGKDCDKVTLTLEHTGKLPADQMGHNWVLTETADFKAVSKAGMKAGLEQDYLPQNDERIIAATDLIGGGESTSVTFSTDKLKAGGDYTFFCSFPGHSATMNGKLVVK